MIASHDRSRAPRAARARRPAERRKALKRDDASVVASNRPTEQPAPTSELAPTDRLAPARPGRQRDIFEEVWSLFASTRLALTLILVISLACLVGVLVIQAPAEMLQSPDATRTWIARVRPRFGILTDVFQMLGFFWVFQTTWFRILLGILAINTIVCTSNRLPTIWRRVFGRPIWPKDELFERGEARETLVFNQVAPGEVAPWVRQVLVKRHYRVVAHPDANRTCLYADRFRLMHFGTVLTHAALVLILGAVTLSGPLGYFEEPGFAVPVGAVRDVGHGTALAIAVDDYADEYYEDGRPKDYRSDVVLYDYDRGGEVVRQTIRVNEPLIYGGIRFHQSFFGQSAIVAVADSDGTSLYRDAVALTWRSTDGARPVGYFFLPRQNLHVYIVGTAGKGDPLIRSGEVVVEAYRGGANLPTFRSTLVQRQPQEIGGLSFTFEREVPFTGLRIVRDPTANLMWLACGLLVFGLVVTFYFPHRKLWARLQASPEGTRVILVGAGRGLAGELGRLAQQLRTASPRPAEEPPVQSATAAQIELAVSTAGRRGSHGR